MTPDPEHYAPPSEPYELAPMPRRRRRIVRLPNEEPARFDGDDRDEPWPEGHWVPLLRRK